MTASPNHSVFVRELSQHDEEVVSPDGQITARVAQGMVRSVRFAPNTYERYSDGSLEAQLVQLAKLAWVSRERARKDAVMATKADGDREFRTRKPTSSAERRLIEQRDREQITVHSSHMTIIVKGGTKWAIRIKPGTVKSIPEETFLRELAALVKAAMKRWTTAMNSLRTNNFGPSEILRSLKHSAR